MSEQKPIYVKVSECKALYSLTRYSLYRYEKAGKLKIHRGTGVNMVKVADLEDLIEGKAAAA